MVERIGGQRELLMHFNIYVAGEEKNKIEIYNLMLKFSYFLTADLDRLLGMAKI